MFKIQFNFVKGEIVFLFNNFILYYEERDVDITTKPDSKCKDKMYLQLHGKWKVKHLKKYKEPSSRLSRVVHT